MVTMAILTAEFMPISVWLRLRSTAVSHRLMESSILMIKLSEPLMIITAFKILIAYPQL